MSANISIFVPHLGCKNNCSFCNQRYIAGDCELPDNTTIENAVNLAINSKNYNPNDTEIAFFGGSFTAIDKKYMLKLLSCGYSYVKKGLVKGIRISTRPDAIDKSVLEILKRYGVTAIELGAQSMDDNVLLKNNRGHTAQQVSIASKLIREYGFELGLQMMTGLFGSDDEKDILTAEKIIEIMPDTVRIYPTIVLENTDLADYFQKGIYSPQSLEAAVELTAKLLQMFFDANIKVIRTGLHTIDETKYLAGPWHPAFSELCLSRIFFEKIKSETLNKGKYTVFVNPKDISKVIGQKKENLLKLKELGLEISVIKDENIKPLEIKIKGDVKN